ncbi:MAG: RDD family protein [Bacteroidetes bacterium]|nr:RDD family protein [Bacteroidota bacterium]
MQETNSDISNNNETPSIFPTRNEEYPSLLKRVQSTFVDGIMTFSIIGVLVAVASKINDENIPLKVTAIVIGASYEPLMLSFSKTLGQRITSLRTRSMETGKRPNLFSSYLRYIVKCMLGWISFLTIHSNPERRAIHDFASGTVVIKNQS